MSMVVKILDTLLEKVRCRISKLKEIVMSEHQMLLTEYESNSYESNTVEKDFTRSKR